ncbi:MAG: glycosyltransferase [Verrucomicrobiales bacterium]
MDAQISQGSDPNNQYLLTALSYPQPNAQGFGAQRRHASILSALKKCINVRLCPLTALEPPTGESSPLLVLGWDSLIRLTQKLHLLPSRLWLDLDELPSKREESMANQGSIKRKAFHRLLEKRFLPTCECIFLSSQVEREHLLKAHPSLDESRVYVWPNVVEPLPLLDQSEVQPPTILFVGHLLYYPNHQGLSWFVEKVLPRLRTALPSLQLLVAGAGSERFAPQPGLHCFGRVDDLQPYYQRCHLAVAPIFSGGGTRLKILEAFAYGRVVVSTSFGALGLEVQHEKHLLLADSVETFADSIVRVLQDLPLHEALKSSARHWVGQNHTPAILQSIVKTTLLTEGLLPYRKPELGY